MGNEVIDIDADYVKQLVTNIKTKANELKGVSATENASINTFKAIDDMCILDVKNKNLVHSMKQVVKEDIESVNTLADEFTSLDDTVAKSIENNGI